MVEIGGLQQSTMVRQCGSIQGWQARWAAGREQSVLASGPPTGPQSGRLLEPRLVADRFRGRRKTCNAFLDILNDAKLLR